MSGQAITAAAALLGERASPHVPLGQLTTYRVGGPAELFMIINSHPDLVAARGAVTATGIPVLVLGKGSNLLVSDRGFPGLAIVLGGEFLAVKEQEGDRVRAGAGVSLPVLARRTAAASLTGFEWAVGVPGSLGGAVRMNAGGHGSDMSRCLVRYWYADLAGGPDGEAPASRLDYSYRHSSLQPHHVVLEAELQLEAGDVTRSEAMIAEIVRWRREHQPGGQNAGSVFTNPPGGSAGRLIEEAGLKGFRQGSAYVSPKHANFFQVDPDGSADDVRRLIEEVRARVEKATGVALVPELRLVGFEPG